MSSIGKKLIIFLTVFIIIFNVWFPIISSADSQTKVDTELNIVEGTFGGLFSVLDGIIGILLWIPKAGFGAILYGVQAIMTQVCGLSGDGVVLTVEDIIFSGSSRNEQVNILNINFFDFNGNGYNDSLVKSFRQGVAKWYYILRNLSIVISLAVLIYIGIRMAISSMASDKARYKEMFKNWVVGFVVLFVLHYFMVLILNLNDALVDLIYKVQESSTSNSVFEDYSTGLFLNIFKTVSFTKGIMSVFLYICLIGTTFAFFVMYMKRLLTIGFLIVISPLITITYSIDKLGDGKSQALNTWMKEFVYGVLIQPFHCIIYIVFVGSVLSMTSGGSLINFVFAIFALLFIFKAEDIVKKIFGFADGANAGGLVAAGAIGGSLVQRLASRNNNAKNKNISNTQRDTSSIQRKPIPGMNRQSTSNPPGNSTTQTGGSQQPTSRMQTHPQNQAQTQANSQATQNVNNPITTAQNNNPDLTTGNNDEKPKRRSAIGRAASDFINEKKDSLREIKANPTGALKNAAIRGGVGLAHVATKLPIKLLAAGLVAGATGNGINGIITGYAVQPGKFTRKVNAVLDEQANETKIEGKAKKIAAAYEKYKVENGNLSDEEMYNRMADLLEADISDLTDKNDINLARQLQEMEKMYELNGEKRPQQRVMDQIEDIQIGNIKNSVSIKMDSVKNAVKNFKVSQQGSNLNNNEIMDRAKGFIVDIDEAKEVGEKYLRSEKYKQLQPDEKVLAKQIYKTKEIFSAIGENSHDSVNEELENAIEKGLIESNQ